MSKPPHSLFSDPVLLDAILQELPRRDLLVTARVARLWCDVAQRRLTQDVTLNSSLAVERFRARAEDSLGGFKSSVRGFRLTRASSALLPLLPTLAPSLTALEILSGVTVASGPELVHLFIHLPRLERLAIVGQDPRTRQRGGAERAGHVEDALQELISARDGASAALPRLRSLSLTNTPVDLLTLDAFLGDYGSRLRLLELEGRGPDASDLLELAAKRCPNLRECSIEGGGSGEAGRAAVGPEAPIEVLSPSPSLHLPSRLTTLTLTSLNRVSTDTFRDFASPSHLFLRTVSLRKCDLVSAHLTFFTTVTHLSVVDCPALDAIPVFVDTFARPDLGKGCRELRHLSVLSSGQGLSLGNLWELAMLGREEGNGKERRRGLQRLTMDGTVSRETFSSAGFFFAFSSPSSAYRNQPPSPLPSAFPSHLAPPAHLAPYLTISVLSADLPSLALLQTLVAAQDLEELSLFGTVPVPSSVRMALLPDTVSVTAQLIAAVRRLIAFALSLLPLIGFLFSPFDPTSAGVSTVRISQDRDDERELVLQAGVETACAREGLPSPPPPCYTSSTASKAALGSAHVYRRRFEEDFGDDEDAAGYGKRLREEEVVWLLDAAKASGGRLRRVFV
ncbi:hypothetical protein JCM6882_008757 [Rhodosporidiobolus microsporus]